RCSLRAAILIFFFGGLAAFFGILSGVITGGTSGALPSDAWPSPVKFASNHWEILTCRSLIAAHPARPKLADTVIVMSATRAHAPIDTLAIRGGRAPSRGIGADASVTPYGCGAVNATLPASGGEAEKVPPRDCAPQRYHIDACPMALPPILQNLVF